MTGSVGGVGVDVFSGLRANKKVRTTTTVIKVPLAMLETPLKSCRMCELWHGGNVQEYDPKS